MHDSKPPAETNRANLLTEQRLVDSTDLDTMPLAQAIALMNRQDALATAAVAAEARPVQKAVELVSSRLASGGRLIYIGAGTSGRLGVLDASECPPTFGVLPETVQGIIAGGEAAMFRSQEGAEDRAESGAADLLARGVNARDVVMGIAAGGTTPYVRGAPEQARCLGAGTIFFCCVQPRINEPAADVVIRPLVGAEVLTGSTRLKAGTATKLVLNQITTLSMVRLGKVYQNLMIDLKASNAKLRDRAQRIVCSITHLPPDECNTLLQAAGGSVKTAIVMHHAHLGRQGAEELIAKFGGNAVAILRK